MVGNGSRTIALEINCLPTLILTLTLNQILTQFFSGVIIRTPSTINDQKLYYGMALDIQKGSSESEKTLWRTHS